MNIDKINGDWIKSQLLKNDKYNADIVDNLNWYASDVSRFISGKLPMSKVRRQAIYYFFKYGNFNDGHIWNIVDSEYIQKNMKNLGLKNKDFVEAFGWGACDVSQYVNGKKPISQSRKQVFFYYIKSLS